MKPRWFWFGLAIFSVSVLAITFVCASTLFGNTPTTEALSPAAANRLDPASMLSSPAASVSEAVPTLQQVAAAAPQDNVAAAPAAQVPADPLVEGQGGTCIKGFIIDRYHQARGNGWRVTITPAEGTSQTLSADPNGHFEFGTLPAGTWTVELAVPEGWQPFTLAAFPVTLSGSGDDCAKVRFKVEALPCLDVIKLDADGRMGFKQKVGIPGWEMTATHDGTALIAVTDGQGECRFENLVPGDWTVKEESKVGWIPAPGQNSEQTINLESPRTPGVCKSLTFINKQIHGGCIQILKVDIDGNPLKYWKITLKRDDGTQPTISKTTDAWGNTLFCGLALGQWTVQEEVKNGWRSVGPTEQRVELTEPGRSEFTTFVNEPLGCIDGYKINHLNQGLSEWTIIARNEETDETFDTVTDKWGFFQFHELAMGTWKVSEVLQAGWEPVTPAEFEVEVTEPFKCQHVRFKNKTDFACVDVYKKDYTDGAGLPGWEITVQSAYAGGSPVTGTTDGTGHVRFNGLTPGTYIISEKMQDDWVAVTAAKRQVTLEATGSCKVITFKNRQTTASWKKYPCGGCWVTHVVSRGDTLYAIARRYGTTVAAIKRANGLYSNTIWVGQKLCILDP